MDSEQAQAALTESARRQEQTIQAGTAPWPWRLVLALAGSFVVLGLSVDLDMVWLGGAVIGAVAAAGMAKAVKLRETRRSRSWTTALVATFVESHKDRAARRRTSVRLTAQGRSRGR